MLPLPVASREEIERLCIENLLTAAEERVFFKDLEGRYIMASAGWLAAEGGGRPLEGVLGKTDFDIFTTRYAADCQAAERRGDHQRSGRGGPARAPDLRPAAPGLGLHHARPAARSRRRRHRDLRHHA